MLDRVHIRGALCDTIVGVQVIHSRVSNTENPQILYLFGIVLYHGCIGKEGLMYDIRDLV